MKKIEEHKFFTDVEVEAGGLHVQVHSNILSSNSDVFHVMLETAPTVNELKQIDMNPLSAEGMKEMVKFLYVRDKSSNGHDEELLEAADKYKVSDLHHMLEMALMDGISTANAVKRLQLSEECHAPQLKQAVIRFVANNSEEILKSDSWRQPSIVKPHLANETYLKIHAFNTH